ncbi:MAG: hypothetical protein IK139_01255 [Lachnospiraceae bacterium]|nr:hypothetical protein [Lachnospiraceae bacterium]
MAGNDRFSVVKNEKGTGAAPELAILAHRVGKVIGAAMIVAVLIAVLILLNRDYQNTVYTDYEIIKKSVRQDSDASRYLAYNGHVLKYSQDGAEAFDGTDRVLWNVTYEMQEPRVATCGDFVALGNARGTEIIVIDSADNLNRIQTKMPVLNFCVSRQGVVAAALEDTGFTWIKLYDSKGTELASVRCSMSESGYPMDISLSESGYLLAVSYARIEGEDIKSSVAFYNFGDVGANENDHYMSGYDFEDTIIPRVHFMNDQSAFAMGDNRLIFFYGDQKPEKIKEYDFDRHVESVYYGDNKVAVLYKMSGDDQNTVDVYDMSGEKILSQRFDLEYSDVILSDDRLIIYNDRRCIITNVKGKIKFEGFFEDPTLLCAPTSDPRRFVLINRETAQLIKMVK